MAEDVSPDPIETDALIIEHVDSAMANVECKRCHALFLAFSVEREARRLAREEATTEDAARVWAESNARSWREAVSSRGVGCLDPDTMPVADCQCGAQLNILDAFKRITGESVSMN